MPEGHTPARTRRLPGPRLLAALTLGGALALACGAAAQGAPGCLARDIQIEQAGVGSVSADALDSDGDSVVLSQACFSQRGLTFETPELRVGAAGVQAQELRIAGTGLTGQAASARLEGGAFALSSLSLDLNLPSGVLGELPLPAGRYHLEADVAQLDQDGALRLGRATLLGQDGQHYALDGAVYRENSLSARHAELGRVAAQDLRLTPGRLEASASLIGLCRDPQADELQLATGPLSATPAGTLAQDARLRVFGHDLLHTARLDLPIQSGSGGLADTVAGLEPGISALGARLAADPPGLAFGGGRYGVRNLFFLDPYDTRLNLVWHPSFFEAGVGMKLGENRLRFGVFEDPNVDNAPLAEIALTGPPVGFGYQLALRAPDHLSDARLGYGGAQGPLAYRLEGGVGRQNGVNAAFGHASASLNLAQQAGPLSLSASLAGDDYLFGVGNQFALTVQGAASLRAGDFGLSLSHLDRRVWGASPLPALVPSPARQTTAVLSYAPPPPPGDGWRFTGASLTAQYDWLAQALTENRLDLSARYGSPEWTLTPRAHYDFALQEVGVGADVLRNTACFAYGLGADVSLQPQLPGSLKFTVGLRFQFR